MKLIIKGCFLFSLLFLPFLTVALAHSPILDDGDSLTTAQKIEDPTKSWVIYSELKEKEDVKYYSFEIQKGEPIYISLFVPPNADEDFEPQLVLFGPGLEKNVSLPSRIENPNKGGAIILEYFKKAEIFYEPFTPSVIKELGELDLEAPKTGKYYIAVYSKSGGPFAFALGKREEFTISEIFLLPISITQIYLWEGQLFIFIILPLLIVLGIGFSLILQHQRKQKTPKSALEWALITAGLTLIGTAANTSCQIVLKGILSGFPWETLISLIFVVIPVFIGITVLKNGLQFNEEFNSKRRILFLIYGLITIGVWTGLYVAPLLLFTASIIPIKNREFKEKETSTFE